MALPAFASTDDYEARFGTAAQLDEDAVEAALSDSSTDVRAFLGAMFVDEDGNIDLSSCNPWAEDVFRKVVCQVANRRLTNPDGLTSDSVSIDGYSRATQVSNDSADTYLKESEKQQLTSAAGRSSFGVWTLGTTRCDAELTDTIPVVGSDEPMPFTYEPLEP